MTIFAVFRVIDPAKMQSALQNAFPNDHLKIADDEWLVSAVGTARDISERLLVTPPGDTGPAIIFSMANYFGRAPTEVWDWIKTKAEHPGG
jgi:hypothetical protein